MYPVILIERGIAMYIEPTVAERVYRLEAVRTVLMAWAVTLAPR
jgi:hypothetical protein